MRRIAVAAVGVVGLAAVLAGCTVPMGAPVAERANEGLSVIGTIRGPNPHMRASIKLGASPATTVEPIAGFNQTEAAAITDGDVVVGSYVSTIKTGPDPAQAFMWTAAGGAVTIPLPSGTVSAEAVDINEHGVVLLNARSVASSYDSRPYLYDTATGVFTALATIAGASAFANDLNDEGVVVGAVGVSAGSSFRAARWTTRRPWPSSPGPPASAPRRSR